MGDTALSWLVALAIAVPHVLYAYIWFFPDKWRAAFKSRSVDVFHAAAWALKGVALDMRRPVGEHARSNS